MLNPILLYLRVKSTLKNFQRSHQRSISEWHKSKIPLVSTHVLCDRKRDVATKLDVHPRASFCVIAAG